MIDDDADALAYPRPLLRRTSWSSLNGPWSFAIDAEAPEHSVLEALPAALVLRTSAFIDAGDQTTFTGWVLSVASRGERIRTTADVVSPTYVPALADTLLDLLIDSPFRDRIGALAPVTS